MPLQGVGLAGAIGASHLWWEFDPATTRQLEGAVTSRAVGPLRISWIRLHTALAHWHGTRTERCIRANPEPYLTLVMPLEGVISLSSAAGNVAVGPHEIAIWDSTQVLTFDIACERYEQISVLIPQRALRADSLACRQLHGSRVQEENILRELCVKHIATLADFLDSALSPYEMSLTRVTTSLADALIATRIQTPHDRDALLSDIKDYVECYIDDESLGPRSIAAAFEISTRYLHKLFAAESVSVTEWIIARRLDRSAEDLAGSDASVTDIAFKWGFKALGHYSRSFKVRFGTTPTAYRSRTQKA